MREALAASTSCFKASLLGGLNYNQKNLCRIIYIKRHFLKHRISLINEQERKLPLNLREFHPIQI